MRFDILNRLGVNRECDRHTGGRTDRQIQTDRRTKLALAIAQS